ncbi:50S ribosomal protein L4 [Ruminiclostridium cellulolyticum]|uniref:Large ribosomal subunit protein uL4 n=1 Tax=Ruminiclostridium cellulolyticum (strain ATCC 35319 / DSM 5812 / JCM 6584 / H10) TaxID=394503 RepID=RL4_RUMCH|nr:50S ribosomal protein L4 [Ruminiclostridium cellulolyticum]B8I7Y0.1 RecName: Full=Large ribosomal subunit protein uL4; AltName: Full=50S ribosomal protein L4 [Ruminiclostridium cellulolyticum H10]ACL75137.1 ribosomal protein L4/L1e [Ruminiclostridium cellulolyticum H10]
MPKVDLYNMKGEVVGDIQLSDNVFGTDVNKDALHAVVVNQLANRRQGTQSTKTKSEVRGGGKKPWRQKGTGRARQGSIRSAQWVKGGIVLGPKPRSYRYTLPKKVKRIAMKSALTSKVSGNEIFVLDALALDAIKTKSMVGVLNNLKVDSSALLVIDSKNENIVKSARNIPGIKTAYVNTLNVFDILKYDKFIITKDAVEKVEEVYA